MPKTMTTKPIRTYAAAFPLVAMLFMSTCGGGATGRLTRTERVVREGSECITQTSRIRVPSPCSTTASSNRCVKVYVDGNSPRYRELFASESC